jgi:hypothetical protein
MATAKMEKFIFFNDNWDIIQKVYHGNVRHNATILLTMDCSFILDINDIDKYLRKSTRALRRLRLIPVHCRPKILILNTGINEMEIFRKDSNNEALRVLQSSILEWPVLPIFRIQGSDPTERARVNFGDFRRNDLQENHGESGQRNWR